MHNFAFQFLFFHRCNNPDFFRLIKLSDSAISSLCTIASSWYWSGKYFFFFSWLLSSSSYLCSGLLYNRLRFGHDLLWILYFFPHYLWYMHESRLMRLNLWYFSLILLKVKLWLHGINFMDEIVCEHLVLIPLMILQSHLILHLVWIYNFS